MASSVFDLFARLLLDTGEFEKGLDDAKGKAESGGSKIGSALATGAKVAGTAFVSAVGVASTAVTAMTKSAVDSYADYEQLVGGVETLFKENAQSVISNSQEAYRTAGMSANEYMETVTGFSASLLQSLDGDTQKAVDMADLAVQDMSDNANKMGTDMGRITDAYQGFAKQNYTMLDNLKLGYGGTKTEMERLVADAEQMNSSFSATRDENGKLTLSFSDVVQAIHIVQDEMGITGTTALEAGSTITGSVSSMKSAWQNLITGVADENANFGQLVDNFINTLVGENGEGGVIGNLIPRIQQTISGLTKLITAASDRILPIIISTIIENLPALIQAGLQIVTTLSGAIMDNLPAIIDTGLQIILTLTDTLIEALPNLIPAITEIIVTIAEKLTEPDTLVHLVRAALDIIVALADGLLQAIPKLLEAVPEIIENLITALIGAIPQFVIAGYELLTALIKDGPKIILEILKFLPDLLISIVTGIIDGIPMIIDAGVELLTSIIEDLPTIISTVIKAIPEIVMGLVKALADNAGKIIESGAKLLTSLAEGILKALPELLMLVPQIINGIVDGLFEGLATVYNTGKEILTSIKDGFMEGIEAAREWGSDLISNFVDGLVSGVSALWGKIVDVAETLASPFKHSVPKVGPFKDEKKWMPHLMENLADGLKKNAHLVTDQIADSFGMTANLSSTLRGASPALAAGPTTNTWNITVNGIDELEEVVRWYQGRQVEGRMR